jgi:hypothetical protein
MRYLTLFLLLPLTACIHRQAWPYIAPGGTLTYYVRHHQCKLLATDPNYSNIYPQHTVDQLWGCDDPETQFWITVEEEQP